MKSKIIGRKNEQRELQKFHYSDKPELVVVYGRRRVGKTFLIKEFFEDEITFYFTGTVGASNKENLSNFDKAIAVSGGGTLPASTNWSDAFDNLKRLLMQKNEDKKVVFFDEMPWLDAHKSGFLTAFDYFWNSWASTFPGMLFICCGSATSWITNKLFRNRGGLHNRVTGRIYLEPFSIGECEQFFDSKGIVMTRYQKAECYMIFGGIPFYLDLFERDLSLSQNVDKLCFAENALLKYEFNELYKSLFNNPGRHITVVETLAKKREGINKQELCQESGLAYNGHLTKTIEELEQCGFIDKYSDFTKQKSGCYYYLKDPFTLFYLRYMQNNNTKDEYFWTNYIEDGGHRAWCGYAFEQLCRAHLRQIKNKLGISGVSTETTSWRSKKSSPGAQVDMLIKRRDGIINLCEIKYVKHPYVITKDIASELERKRAVFQMETGVRNAVHITMVTTWGLDKSGYKSIAQADIKLDDLFV